MSTEPSFSDTLKKLQSQVEQFSGVSPTQKVAPPKFGEIDKTVNTTVSKNTPTSSINWKEFINKNKLFLIPILTFIFLLWAKPRIITQVNDKNVRVLSIKKLIISTLFISGLIGAGIYYYKNRQTI